MASDKSVMPEGFEALPPEDLGGPDGVHGGEQGETLTGS